MEGERRNKKIFRWYSCTATLAEGYTVQVQQYRGIQSTDSKVRMGTQYSSLCTVQRETQYSYCSTAGYTVQVQQYKGIHNTDITVSRDSQQETESLEKVYTGQVQLIKKVCKERCIVNIRQHLTYSKFYRIMHNSWTVCTIHDHWTVCSIHEHCMKKLRYCSA